MFLVMNIHGAFVFKNVPATHPIAILNAGKEDIIKYEGDPGLVVYKYVGGYNTLFTTETS